MVVGGTSICGHRGHFTKNLRVPSLKIVPTSPKQSKELLHFDNLGGYFIKRNISLKEPRLLASCNVYLISD